MSVGRSLAAVAAALGLAGCTATVVPPARVAEPARVALLDHGRHASLLMETADGGMLQYAYGDWGWFAEGQTGVIEGSSAVLWPTPAALGRMRLEGPLTPASVAREIRVPVEDALYFVVETSAVDRLVARLDGIFRDGGRSPVYNPAHHLMFTPHPEPYSILHNSNQVTAQWLEELGCRVAGPSVLSAWRLAASE